MINIAVVDDEQSERQTMEGYFKRMESEIHEEVTVTLFASVMALLEAYDYSFDLICMDIDMPQMDGLSTAQEIRSRDNDVLIIFVTNLAQLAIRGYEVRALDFLVKPVNYYSFVMKLQDAIQLALRRKQRNIVLNTGEGIQVIPSNELYFAEVRGHYLFYHTKTGTVRQKAPLWELEEKLRGLSFKRCNQSYLINLRHVSAVNKDDILVGGEWIRISRHKKRSFLQSLAHYIGGIEP